MVRVVRTPDIARHLFTAEQLSGLPAGKTFTATTKRRRRKTKHLHKFVPADASKVQTPEPLF